MSERETLEAAVRAALEAIPAPGGTVAGLTRHLTACDGAVKLTLGLPSSDGPEARRLLPAVEQTLRALPGVAHVNLKVEGSLSAPHHDHGNTQAQIRHIVAVASGKGGVGKSTVATNLATGLARFGLKVGLLDADVYGPSIPVMLGRPTAKPPAKKGPGGRDVVGTLSAHGVEMTSMGFLVEEDQPLIWRGPMLHKWLSLFFDDVDWGQLDVLIVDMPPGTGDVALTLAQKVRLAGAIIVSTPQRVAMMDAKKSLNMFKQTNVDCLGIVENMSGPVFGEGTCAVWAEEQGVPFLGSLPLNAAVREGGDAGTPAATSDDPEVNGPFLALAERVALSLAQRGASEDDAPIISLERS